MPQRTYNLREAPLSKRLKELRIERGLSLRDAVAEIDLTDSMLSKMETGKTAKPTQESLNQLAQVYGIDAEELWTLADYHVATKLPSFTPYLRSRYDLPPEAIAELDDHFAYIRAKYEPRDTNNTNNEDKKLAR